MKMRLLGLVLVVSSLLTSAALAKGYGTAGCGIGAMIWGDQPGMIQVLAATFNGTSASQTFGISSGTSNCADTGGGTASAKAFIETNREALAKDIARGSGETIESLSTLAGCKDASQVGTTLQKDFQKIYPTVNTKDDTVVQAILDTLKTSTPLECKKLS